MYVNGVHPPNCPLRAVPHNAIDLQIHIGISLWYDPHIMGILATPPKATPPRNKALLRAY